MTGTITTREDREPPPGFSLGPPQEQPVQWRKQAVRNRLFQEPSMPARVGRFIVLGALGSGGMGTVLRAYDETLDRRVAVKLMHPGVHERHDRRMLREAQALARLSHPNVVQVYEVGEVAGQMFIAMELVAGQTLERWQEGGRSWRQCLEVYVQAGRGLAAAHAAGMVHRDLKPSNCIMDEDGRVRVLDFGLARHSEWAEDEEDRSPSSSGVSLSALEEKLTVTGSVLGTIAYMAPEQMQGKEIDARADQYSFCVSLYEALLGERPRLDGKRLSSSSSGSSARFALRRRGGVPRWLLRILERGLADQPAARWASMDALLDRLERGRRRRSAGWIGGGVALAGLSVAGVLLLARGEAPELPDPCVDAAGPMGGVWDDERREQIRQAILAPELAFGAKTWASVESQLDGYAGAIGSAYVEACEATMVHHEQTRDDLHLRRYCLDERVGALRQTLAVLDEADARVVENAVTMVVALPDVGSCADPAALRKGNPDQNETDEQRSLREPLQQARALMAAGKASDGLAIAEQVAASATKLGAVVELTEAQLVEGELLADLGRFEPAVTSLRPAFLEAVEQGLDALAVEALGELVFLVGVEQAKGDVGAWLGAMAEALMERHEAGTLVQAQVLTAMAQLASARGEYPVAQAQLERVVTLLRQRLGEDHIALAEPLDTLGVALRNQDKYEQAREQSQRALDIRIRWLGPEHPYSAHQRTNLGVVLDNLDEVEQAHAQYREALEILMARPSEHLELQAHARRSWGVSLANQERFDEAAHELRLAVDALVSVHGPEHPWVVQTRLSLAGALRGHRKPEDAVAEYERVLAAVRAVEPTPDIEVATIAALQGLVKTLKGLDREDEAAAYREQLELLEASRR